MWLSTFPTSDLWSGPLGRMLLRRVLLGKPAVNVRAPVADRTLNPSRARSARSHAARPPTPAASTSDLRTPSDSHVAGGRILPRLDAPTPVLTCGDAPNDLIGRNRALSSSM